VSAGQGGRDGIAATPRRERAILAGDVEGEAVDDDVEDGPIPTLEELRQQSGGEVVDRQPLLTTDQVPVAPDEWPLGFPLQGLPRAAVTFNLSYVYNDDREQWEREKKGDKGPTVSLGAAVSRGQLTIGQGRQPEPPALRNDIQGSNTGQQPTVSTDVS